MRGSPALARRPGSRGSEGGVSCPRFTLPLCLCRRCFSIIEFQTCRRSRESVCAPRWRRRQAAGLRGGGLVSGSHSSQAPAGTSPASSWSAHAGGAAPSACLSAVHALSCPTPCVCPARWPGVAFILCSGTSGLFLKCHHEKLIFNHCVLPSGIMTLPFYSLTL